MSADRKKLEAGRERALELLTHPDEKVRASAKKALDHSDVALGMLDPHDALADGRRAGRHAQHAEFYRQFRLDRRSARLGLRENGAERGMRVGAWRNAIAAALMLPGMAGAAGAQTAVRAPDEVKACLCKEQQVSALNGEVMSQSSAYEAKRQAFEALDKQVQTARPLVNVTNRAEIDGFKLLLARRDEAADAFADAANQSYAEAVKRYNDAVSDYNASCASKAFDPEQVAGMKRTLSCAKP